MKKVTFRAKEKLDFPCYKYRWHLYLGNKVIASTRKLESIRDFILSELGGWDCLTIEANLKVVALCKKKETGEILQVEYEILCEE